MSKLLDTVADEYRARIPDGTTTSVSDPEITEVLHEHDVRGLSRALREYVRQKDSVWLLFDNLDKGWPSHGLEDQDLSLIRTLLEATRKIERELARYDVETHTVVFLRNDVYEMLVDRTADRGKESKVQLDWTDPDMLRELVRRRLVHGGLPTEASFDEMWRQICVSHIHGEESFNYIVERSLMRPRYLIDLINHCKSVAVNLNHESIQEQDVEKGVSTFSTDLVSEIDLEIRDIYPNARDVLYAFIGCDSTVFHSEVESNLEELGVASEETEKLIELLIWYGVLGVVVEGKETTFIHDVNYSYKTLVGIRRKQGGDDPIYEISPAFWKGLAIDGKS